MKPLVIQLLGQARSGKDWTAAQLKAYFESQGKSVEIYSYAAPMKQIVATLFDISLEQLDDGKNHPDVISVEVVDYFGSAKLHSDRVVRETNFRSLLQRMGNEAIKPIFGDDVWAKLAQQHINKSSADIIITPDCRFNVELNTIGGVTVRILNYALPRPIQHVSELELLNYVTHYSLDNTDHSLTSEDIETIAQRILNEG